MVILISVVCVWLLGAAFGYGWSLGARIEAGEKFEGTLHHSIWIAWPMYKLGYLCGQRYTARELAPQRMIDKLKQEEAAQQVQSPWQQASFTRPQSFTVKGSGIGYIGGTSGTP